MAYTPPKWQEEKNMKVFLVRHGESEGNKKQVCFGQTDYELTPQGIGHAKQARKKLESAEYTVCFTSKLCRATKTAEIILEGSSVSIFKDARLNEQFMGSFEDMDGASLTKLYPKEFDAMMQNWICNPPVDGETFEDMYCRVRSIVDEILDKGEDVLIVAHNGSLAMITTYLLGLPREAVNCFYFDYGSYSMIDIQSWGRRLRKFNS